MFYSEKSLQRLPLPDAEVYYSPHFFDVEESNTYLQELLQTINWKQESIKLFGKLQPMPRLTAWYGDKGYTYSGLHNTPQPWLPVLQRLKEQVEEASEQAYNSVLLNLYRSGNDSMGWHADDEAELGQDPNIASVSLGGERKFGFRHKSNKAQKNIYITLQHGSLLLMQGPTQHAWQHNLPKTQRAVMPRINLTFRNIKG
ncbi:alpha-ketoglutarate-dependent dioxygenase AlkB family protein [Pontibacter silvestris]|uniref:Alpha-ketoglutarate-dependent dioxygenase AlkB family protein n=1 Tax=Pontibacter silvestris TaxID=2305183 RepID=A0ABW4WWB2_9BACT|nr:alpha-ketoglutarate-dependent dioxygenase AlkB [Pontibacter silvestris]MCC9136581.1 alpha-ketoglutarate-dependent dioxygenase AlkB [Pontibacter silvestris]